MKPSKKMQKRLDARIAAHSAMIKGGIHEQKVHIRIATGGYTCPGSRKKASK